MIDEILTESLGLAGEADAKGVTQRFFICVEHEGKVNKEGGENRAREDRVEVGIGVRVGGTGVQLADVQEVLVREQVSDHRSGDEASRKLGENVRFELTDTEQKRGNPASLEPTTRNIDSN